VKCTDPADPHVLVGVALPAAADATRQMAVAVASEFAQLGFSAPQILAIFRNRFYAGAYAARAALGDEAIARIVDEEVAVWSRVRIVIAEPLEVQSCRR